MKIEILSFGFRYGRPEAELLLDLRCLQNPYWEPSLRALSGRDQPIEDYVFRDPDACKLAQTLAELVRLQSSIAERKGAAAFTVACGCTGGHHRSVAMAERLARLLRADGMAVTLRHRDLDKTVE